MKPNMKKKVTAQRKFALGANMPAASPSERRTIIRSKDVPGPSRQIKMPPAHLLDFVSMHKLQKNDLKEPIVLVERLHENVNGEETKKIQNGHQQPSVRKTRNTRVVIQRLLSAEPVLKIKRRKVFSAPTRVTRSKLNVRAVNRRAQSQQPTPPSPRSAAPKTPSPRAAAPTTPSPRAAAPTPPSSRAAAPMPPSSRASAPMPPSSRAAAPTPSSSRAAAPTPPSSRAAAPTPSSSRAAAPTPPSSRATAPTPSSSRVSAPAPPSSRAAAPTPPSSRAAAPTPPSARATALTPPSSQAAAPTPPSARAAAPTPLSARAAAPPPHKNTAVAGVGPRKNSPLLSGSSSDDEIPLKRISQKNSDLERNSSIQKAVKRKLSGSDSENMPSTSHVAKSSSNNAKTRAGQTKAMVSKDNETKTVQNKGGDIKTFQKSNSLTVTPNNPLSVTKPAAKSPSEDPARSQGIKKTLPPRPPYAAPPRLALVPVSSLSEDKFKVPQPPPRVATSAEPQASGTGADVYAFDDSESAASDGRRPDFRQNRRRSRPDEGQEHYKYFELPQDSSHLIQLASVKQKQRVMRARLIPKTVIQTDKEKPAQGSLDKSAGARSQPVGGRSSPGMDRPLENAKQAAGDWPTGRPSPVTDKPQENAEQAVGDRPAGRASPVTDTPPDNSEQAMTDKGKTPVKKVHFEPTQSVEPPPPPANFGEVLQAPVFHPTKAEFEYPLAYIERISPLASKFGLCKIVPPAAFKPTCYLDDKIRFEATNQYPAKMLSRWGPATKELCAIKTHLATQNVNFSRPPLVESVEVDLPKLYHIVQAMGGLNRVIENELWAKVAEEMNFPREIHVESKLDKVYVKYLLPYDTLDDKEREMILERVEGAWCRRYMYMLQRAAWPLHRQRQLLYESSEDEDEEEAHGGVVKVESEDSELEEEAENLQLEDDSDGSEGSCLEVEAVDRADKAEERADDALADADDCVVAGRSMSIATFDKASHIVMKMQFPEQAAAGRDPTPEEVEDRYWQLVVSRDEHVCVNTGNLDTGRQGYGFSRRKGDPYSRHPWNLKVLAQSAPSVLRSLGTVLSVTVPTLHLGMVFSTSCWHRDPHGLPWIEYMHTGPPKIWYGIPDEQTDNFRRAVEEHCPTYCQNKGIWLPTDITMIPPHLLTGHNVSLTRTEQHPGEFIVVFPKAYSCSVCTGHTVSESVYYAPTSWLDTMMSTFEAVRASFEPTMFSCEQLLISIVEDTRASPRVLATAHRALARVVDKELAIRKQLMLKGVVMKDAHLPKRQWSASVFAECDVCRSALFLSKVSGLVSRTSSHCPQHALQILTHAPAHALAAAPATLLCYQPNVKLYTLRSQRRTKTRSARPRL